jgi:hypothetical protein
MEQRKFPTEIHKFSEGIGNVCFGIFLSNLDYTCRHCLSDDMIVDCIVFLCKY